MIEMLERRGRFVSITLLMALVLRSPMILAAQRPTANAEFVEKSRVKSLVYSPDGLFLATAISGAQKAEVGIWSVRTQKRAHLPVPSSKIINCLAFAPNGVILAGVIDDMEICLWNASLNKIVRRISMPKEFGGNVTEIKFSADGTHMLAVTGFLTTYIWNIKEWKLTSKHEESYSSFMGKKSNVGVLSMGNVFRIYSPSGKPLSREVKCGSNYVDVISVNPNGKDALVWTMSRAEIWVGFPYRKKIIAVDEGMRGDNGGMSYSKNGDLMCRFTSDENSVRRHLGDMVRIYKTGSFKLLRTITLEERVNGARISPDGKFVAIVSDRKIGVFPLAAG